jgi:sodium pump decarboxylase gamma subunit
MLKKLGDVTGFAQDKKGFSAQINDSDMTVTVSVVGSTGRTGSVTVIYGQYGPKQIQASLNDTFGEGMAKAGMNTLLGMGMAFFVLIIIALVIKFAFPPINRLSQKLDEQNAQASARRPAPAAAPAVAAASSAQQDETGDGALVAVIAAAVAAAEGRKDTSGFVVRSIRKSR